MSVAPDHLLADGYDSATLTIESERRSARIGHWSSDPGRRRRPMAGPGRRATRTCGAAGRSGVGRADHSPEYRRPVRRRHSRFSAAGRRAGPAGLPPMVHVPGGRGRPAGGDQRLRGADPVRLPRGPAGARYAHGPRRRGCPGAGLRVGAKVPLSLYSAGGIALPGEGRTVPARRPGERSVRAICRRADAVPAQQLFGSAAIFHGPSPAICSSSARMPRMSRFTA